MLMLISSTTVSHTEAEIPGFFHCASVYVIVYQM